MKAPASAGAFVYPERRPSVVGSVRLGTAPVEEGWMFWLNRNMFAGSYRLLMTASRP
jgi:hypothetical protein